MSMVQLSKRLKISQLTVRQSGTRGEKFAKENKLKLLQNKQSTYQGMSLKPLKTHQTGLAAQYNSYISLKR